MNVRDKVNELRSELVDLRRDFHKHPELGFQEHRTSRIIADYLSNCGLEVKRMAKTGIVGLLKGSAPGRTLLLRADIDALPVSELNDVSYKSVYPGKMHACGHDGHIAMLLVAAKILAQYQTHIRGNVKFVFQPNEEDAGAYLMVEEGVMKDPQVDAAVGCHLWSLLEAGKVDVSPGPVMAESQYFYLTVKGKGGHAGFVHESVDPIIVAATIIQCAQAVQTRETNALDPSVLMFTRIDAGENTTIVPETAQLEGSIRTLYEGGGEECREKLNRIVEHVCKAYRAEYELSTKLGNGLVSNHPEMAELVRRAAERVVESGNVTSRVRTMAGDDFSEFARLVPSTYFFIGTKNREKGSDYPHHHPRFNIDEDALPIGARMYVEIALSYLS